MTAIVTDVHYRMSLALVRTLGEAGVEVITCERDGRRGSPDAPPLGALSRRAARHVWLPEEGYLDALLELCRETGQGKGCRPALLPVGAGTLGLLAADRERFDGAGGLCIPTAGQLDLMNSKEQISLLAAKLGIPVPESFVRREGEDLTAFSRRLPLPCVIKPVCGEKLGLTARDRYAVVKSPEDAERQYGRFLALAGEPPVVQAYLSGGGLGCSVLALEGKVLASICHRRVREYPVTGGPSSCCVQEDREDLRTYAARLTAETGYTGLAMFEFKEDQNGEARLLEVNPRVWGTFPLTRAAGSELPLLWYVLAWNAGNPDRPLPYPAPVPACGRRMIFAASDLTAALGYAGRGEPGMLLRALGDFLNPAVADGVFEWGDIRPGLAYFRSLLAKERHK